MNIILFGKPGSGKGTQAVLMSLRFKIPHISTGDIFRHEVRIKSKLGLRIEAIMKEGTQLVSDEIAMQVVENRLNQNDCKQGFLFDGFPRTIIQAKKFGALLEKMHKKIDHVIYLKVKDSLIVHRLAARRQCPECKQIYGLDKLHLPEDKCPDCRVKFIFRPDDNPEIAKGRLKTYSKQTKPLIAYYKKQKKLLEINGEYSPQQVLLEVIRAIDKRK